MAGVIVGTSAGVAPGGQLAAPSAHAQLPALPNLPAPPKLPDLPAPPKLPTPPAPPAFPKVPAPKPPQLPEIRMPEKPSIPGVPGSSSSDMPDSSDKPRAPKPTKKPVTPATADELASWGGPKNSTIRGVHDRTSMAVVTARGIAKTGNADVAHPALSIVKLYLAEYVLASGDKSGEDRYDAQRMIRQSDDDAAQKLYDKYPHAITRIAQRYGLSSTQVGKTWGTSLTSATDVAVFLNKLRNSDPDSVILHWMATSAPVAADGTQQTWGTSHLADAQGTKWGWSDRGPETVASATYGNGYTAAAFTWGSPEEQTGDVQGSHAGR